MFAPWVDPFRMLRAQLYVASMAMEASSVIFMRVMGMNGLWSVPSTENTRMVTEKQTAFLKSGQKAFDAVMSGKPLDAVVMAAAKPLRSKTSANQKRLTRLGPRRTF